MKENRITIRIEESVKDEANDICEKLGIDLSTAIRVFLIKFNDTKGFPWLLREEE